MFAAETASPSSPQKSSPSSSSKSRKKRPWKRTLLLWLLGIVLGLIVLALAAWWQRLWIARSLWTQLVERMAAEEVYLGGEVSSVEWEEGLSLENLTFYADSAHAVPLFALESLRLRPEQNPAWGVQLSAQDTQAMIYSNLRQEQINPLHLEIHFSQKQLKLEQFQGILGVMNFDLQDIVYQFSQAKDEQFAETASEPEDDSSEAEDERLTPERIEEFLSWLDWELAQGGEFSLQIQRLRATQEGLQDLDANIRIAHAHLPSHELSLESLLLETPKQLTENLKKPEIMPELGFVLQGQGLAWGRFLCEEPLGGYFVQISPQQQQNPKDQDGQDELLINSMATLVLPKLVYTSSRGNLEFSQVTLSFQDTSEGLNLALSTHQGNIGSQPILPLEAVATRKDQILTIDFIDQEATLDPSLDPVPLALEGSLVWDGQQKLLQVPELTLDLDLWKIAASLREREAVLGQLESRSVPRVVITKARGDFSQEQPQLEGSVTFTRAAEFYSPEFDFAFGLETGNYHLQESALVLDNLTGTFVGAPIQAQGELSWANPQQPLLFLERAELAPDLEPLAKLAKLEEEQRVKLRGKPQISLSKVSLPLQNLRELRVEDFQIQGDIDIERSNEQGRVLSARFTQISGSCQPGLLSLQQFQAQIMDAELFAGASQLHFLGEDKRLRLEALELSQLDLAQLGAYLNSQERWNLEFQGTIKDFLLGEFTIPLEDQARPEIQAFYLNSDNAQVTLERNSENSEEDGSGTTQRLPLGLRLLQGKLSPTDLKLESGQLALGEGSLKLRNLALPLPSDEPESIQIPPPPQDLRLLRIQSIQAQNLPAQSIGEFTQLERFGIELGGSSNLQIENFILPLSSPSQLQAQSLSETGNLQIRYRRNPQAEPLNFTIEETQARYSPQGMDFEGLKGQALGGDIELGKTQLRWEGQARGIVTESLQARPDLSQLEPILQLEDKRLRLGGTPLIKLDQVQLNFQDPSAFDIQDLAIEDPILLGVRTGEDKWLDIKIETLEGLYNPGEFTATALQARLFDGTIVLDGSKVSWAEGVQWRVPDLSVESLDLSQLAVWAGMEKDGSLQGFLEAFGELQGSAEIAELQGQLELDAREGRFYSLPVLGPLHLLLKELIPQLPEDVAEVAQVTLNFGEGKISTDDLLIESTATQINLEGEYEFANQQVKADAAVNFRGLVGVATFLLSEALKVRGQGPVDDVKYSFTYLPLPGIGNFDQFEQLPDNFLSLPGVSEIPGVKEIPGIGEALEAVDGVRNIPLIRDIPFIGRKKQEAEEIEEEILEPEVIEAEE